mgnify:CR=1 FL=1
MNNDPGIQQSNQPNENYDTWAKMANEVRQDSEKPAEYANESPDIVGLMSDDDRTYFESCKSDNMPFVVNSGDGLLPAISESREVYTDNRKYAIQEAAELFLEGFDTSVVRNGTFSTADLIKVKTIRRGEDPSHPIIEDVDAKIAEVVPGYNVSIVGEQNKPVFYSREYVDYHFKENQDGTYTNETLYKGVKNNTGVEINLGGLMAVNDYIDNDKLSEENSKDQLILAEFGPDNGGKVVPGTVQVVSQSAGNFVRDKHWN